MYRSYYALPPLHTPEGKPVQAIYGFCRTLNMIINEFDPEYIAIIWDSKGGSQEKKEIFSEYKATRQAPPADIHVQKEDMLEFLETIDMASISKIGYEADDLIGSITLNTKDQQVVIVCADKDMYQLLSDNVIIIDPFKNKIVDEQLYTEEQGFPPAKIPFYYSLLGDVSDNIPGVAGVGKKTAETLAKQFASLEDLYNNLNKVEKHRTKKLLEEQKENAFLSYKLFFLNYRSFKLSKKESQYDKRDWAKAAEFFQRLNFKSLLKDIEKKYGGKEYQTTIGHAAPEQQDWECIIITQTKQLKALITQLKKHAFFGIDTETSGVLPLQDELVGISFAYDKKKAYYLPLGHPIDKQYPQIDKQEALDLLKPIFESKTIKKTLHNSKFDELVLWNNGISMQGVSFDTIIAANLVKKEWQKINLKDLSLFYLKERMLKYKEVVGTKYKTFAEVPIAKGSPYGAHDALQTLKLYECFSTELEKEPTLKKLFENIEMPLYRVLMAMEKKGVLVNEEVLVDLGKIIEKDVKKIEDKIFAALPPEEKSLNLNSPRQIEVLLFDHLQLPTVKKSKKGSRSTDQEVLNVLSKIHPVPGLILKHRELTKLKSTYVLPLPDYINVSTGRIHSSFSQTMTATGRLSSMNPNLQNIPASSGHGIKVRSAFIAPESHLFLSADYSQIELRVLAHLTKDENLTNAFLEEKDIHAQTAAQLFDVPINKVTHAQRQLGKRINFSIIYGKTPFGLSRELGITPSEAKNYIEAYFQQYPKVGSWMEHIVENALEDGYVQTWQGKRRYVPELREKNRTRFELGKRIAINTVVQGTSADIIKIGMINIHKAFEPLKAALILQIHDELVIELPQKELSDVKKIVKEQMENVTNWKIPLIVSIRTGSNWEKITK